MAEPAQGGEAVSAELVRLPLGVVDFPDLDGRYLFFPDEKAYEDFLLGNHENLLGVHIVRKYKLPITLAKFCAQYVEVHYASE